ncbi:hypothetical protein [Limnovirga soli]|uniref:Uncharacterized protein n=1 Tax=Limnovirga soli TaxID=2656915 RepID=A0A8J8JQ23_9BACT|nr:hypothetical protein [Limnovirga soli]NNV54257.1 hypothetical protein [Limnovirga soli]
MTSLSAVGQTPPDSVVITINTYVNNFSDSDNIYHTDNFPIILDGKKYFLNDDRIAKSKILELLNELTNPGNTNNSLAKYELDTNWIKSNPANLLSLYSDRNRIDWNEQQKEFIFKKLTDLSFYNEELNDLLLSGQGYTMHHRYKNEYLIKFYNNGIISNEIKSRKYVWGYKMPWLNQSGDTLYNFNIETKLKDILSTKEKLKAPLKGEKLQKYLVNKIIDNNMASLYKLSAYSYQNEINELKSDFSVVSFEEVYGRGRYIWDEPKTMKIVLKNNLMYDNVSLVFLASKYGNTIYSRDSIKNDYTNYVNRIQSVKFISDYLKANPTSRLDIYYFNNKGINDYNIESVNKNPTTWARHDKWVESLRWSEKNNIKMTFDIDQSIKTSQQNDCGCNYRFDKSYIEKAIFFEINDATNSSSIWFLLPDNTVLLYIMDNLTALNFKRSDFNDNKEYGLIYPCAIFNSNGQKVPK